MRAIHFLKGTKNMNSSPLTLVHVLARHGDRTTDASTIYPTDPHRSNKYYPYGQGMITNIGKRNMYNLGKQFRARYDEYLGELYIPQELETWTTEYIRTRVSGQLFLAGLFPPKGALKWHDNLNWQPIHTNYVPLENDMLMGAYIKNKKYIDTYKKRVDSDYGKTIMKKYQDVIPYLEKHSGQTFPNTRQLFILYDCLRTEVEFGLSLPEWTKEVFPDKLEEAFHDELKLATSTKELKRYLYGGFLKKILIDTKNKINNKSQYKMHFYLGHDINIAFVLIGLELMYEHSPKYCASITFEVHQINNRYGIKIFYKKQIDSDFELMKLRNGENILWLEDLEEIVNDLWSDDNNEL